MNYVIIIHNNTAKVNFRNSFSWVLNYHLYTCISGPTYYIVNYKLVLEIMMLQGNSSNIPHERRIHYVSVYFLVGLLSVCQEFLSCGIILIGLHGIAILHLICEHRVGRHPPSHSRVDHIGQHHK